MAKILVMDDEAPLRNMLSNILSPLGHNIVTAQSGLQAIALAKNDALEVALLDMHVSDMGGHEVMLELVRQNPSIKCIMLASFGDVESASWSVKKGAFDYLNKPFKIHEVQKVINRALNIHNKEYAAPVSGELADNIPVMTQQVSSKPGEIVIKKRFSLFAHLLIMMGIAVAALYVYNFFGIPQAKMAALPYSSPSAIAASDTNMWIAELSTGNIYEHRSDKEFPIVSVHKTINQRPAGLAYDGEYLWTSNTDSKKLYKHRADSALSPVLEVTLPDETPAILYSDGSFLWNMDPLSGKIYKHALDSKLTLVKQYISPCESPTGLFRAGRYMYISSSLGAKIFRVAADDFSGAESFTIKEMKSKNYKIAAIAGNDKTIIACAQNSGKLFILPLWLLEGGKK